MRLTLRAAARRAWILAISALAATTALAALDHLARPVPSGASPSAGLLAGAQAASPAPAQTPAWPDIGVDGQTPASALEHILDRTVVIINGTSTKLYFSILLPNEGEWVQYPATPGSPQGIYCPTCVEDATFRFYIKTTQATLNSELKANYRYMIVAGGSGSWELVQGPPLH